MSDGEAAPSAAAEQNTYGLAEEVLDVLPSDPFAQLDVARKITSLALATRVSALESEAADLHRQLSDKDQLVADLRGQIQAFDALLSDAAERIAAADREKEALLKEKEQLSTAISKLSRDVSKLEIFRKTLIRSIQEDDENSGGAQKAVASSSQSTGEENRLRVSPVLLSSSQTSTPRYTPPGSPPLFFMSGSPNTSNPATPRRSSISFSTSRGALDVGNGSGSQSRTRVDGKEFFRQVRSRLSYEQFGAFLANVKELNSQKQTKEETLRKADEIFGSDNRDLYTTFEGLLFHKMH